MNDPNYYAILEIDYHAPQTEIKQAYRRLVKQYHPDLNHDLSDNETIVKINVAYEILSNPNSRASYDRSIGINTRTKEVPVSIKIKSRKTEDERLQEWMLNVYEPVCSMVADILDQLQDQIDALAYDPFDDDLMSVFLAYLDQCQKNYNKSQELFRRFPNPSSKARSAEYLFHCLNQLGDGIEELYYFTSNFDDRHLHTGIELWRIAKEMYLSAQADV